MRKQISLFLLLFLLVFEVNAALAAPIGVVQRPAGDVWIYSRTERARHINAGDAFESGVSISTGARSSVVLRFQDGQTVVLASNATFRVKTFAFNPTEPAKGQILFELVKGGARFVTGSIGESNRGGWQLVTPSANVMVDGTDFFAVIEQGLYAHVNAGAVTLANSAGTVTLPAGGTAFVAGEAAVPVSATAVPDGLFGELQAVALNVPGGAPSLGAGSAAAGSSSAVGISSILIAIAVGAAAVAAAASGGSTTTTHH